MICTSCGHRLPENSSTCTVCGAVYRRAAPRQPAPYDASTTPPSQPRPIYPAHQASPYPAAPSHAPGHTPSYTQPRQAPLHPTRGHDHSASQPQRQSPYPPRQTVPPSPSNSQSKPGGKQTSAGIAVIIALIIFFMQMNWITVSIDVGDMSRDLMANVVSHEDIWEILQAAGVTNELQSIDDYPSLVELINALTNMINREIREFSDRVLAFDPHVFLHDPLAFDPSALVSDPPDITGIVNAFSDLLLWEVVRVSEGMGQLEQSISISDLPNLIEFTNLITDMIIREGASWGMETETVQSLSQNTEPIQTAEQIIGIIRVVFVLCVMLLVIFMYLLIVGAKPACIVGQIIMFIIFLLSGGFAVALLIGNRMVADALGGFVQISASWHVYAAIILSVLGFVLIVLHRKGLRLPGS